MRPNSVTAATATSCGTEIPWRSWAGPVPPDCWAIAVQVLRPPAPLGPTRVHRSTHPRSSMTLIISRMMRTAMARRSPTMLTRRATTRTPAPRVRLRGLWPRRSRGRQRSELLRFTCWRVATKSARPKYWSQISTLWVGCRGLAMSGPQPAVRAYYCLTARQSAVRPSCSKPGA